MIDNKNKKREDFIRALHEIDIIFQVSKKKIIKLHARKMKLISDYQEFDRQEEIKNIRQSLKNI